LGCEVANAAPRIAVPDQEVNRLTPHRTHKHTIKKWIVKIWTRNPRPLRTAKYKDTGRVNGLLGKLIASASTLQQPRANSQSFNEVSSAVCRQGLSYILTNSKISTTTTCTPWRRAAATVSPKSSPYWRSTSQTFKEVASAPLALSTGSRQATFGAGGRTRRSCWLPLVIAKLPHEPHVGSLAAEDDPSTTSWMRSCTLGSPTGTTRDSAYIRLQTANIYRHLHVADATGFEASSG
jgi:hypothetical protein